MGYVARSVVANLILIAITSTSIRKPERFLESERRVKRFLNSQLK